MGSLTSRYWPTRWLFEWVVGSQAGSTSFRTIEGPRVLIVESPPRVR